jgi:hypothetical protein
MAFFFPSEAPGFYKGSAFIFRQAGPTLFLDFFRGADFQASPAEDFPTDFIENDLKKYFNGKKPIFAKKYLLAKIRKTIQGGMG